MFPNISCFAFRVGDSNRYRKFLVIGVGRSEEILDLISKYEEDAQVAGLEILQKSRRVVLCLVTLNLRRLSDNHDLFEIVYKSNCIHVDPLLLRNGEKRFRIIAPSKKSLEALKKKLGKVGDLNIIDLRPITDQELFTFWGINSVPLHTLKLSAMQYKTISLAWRKGYYNWRRDITLSDIAKELGIAISTASEHLRKAEDRVIGSVIASLSEHSCIQGTSLFLPRELLENSFKNKFKKASPTFS